jgi:hypothetical protein
MRYKKKGKGASKKKSFGIEIRNNNTIEKQGDEKMKAMKLVGTLAVGLVVAGSAFAGGIERPVAREGVERALDGLVPAEAREQTARVFREKLGTGLSVTAAAMAAFMASQSQASVSVEHYDRVSAIVEKAAKGGTTEVANRVDTMRLMGSLASQGSTCQLTRTFTSPEQVALGKEFKEVQANFAQLGSALATVGVSHQGDIASISEWARTGTDVGRGANILMAELRKAAEEAAAKGLKGEEALAYVRAAGLRLVETSTPGTEAEKTEAAREFGEACMRSFV